jgi:GTP-binding protein EngB required for normal cell division
VTAAQLQHILQTAVAHLTRHSPTARLAVRLQALQERLGTGRFHLAVLGQFKRGKSTLLNALLGEPFLPMAVVPLTAIPTLITYGPVREVQVIFQDGRETAVAPNALDQYVTETANPGNTLGVARVDVRHPAPLLAQGVVLIDTPGIGSTLSHNTETTLEFLTEVDAALFLLSADPPITAVEVEFLQAVQQRVSRLFFLLNKVDYLTPAEQEQTLAFVETTLRQQAQLNGDLTLFPISARLALEARQQGDDHAWQTSGLAAVEMQLLQFLNQEKQAALEQAIAAKAAATLQGARQLMQTERRALTMPLDELQQKRSAFQATLNKARRQRQQAADMLQGDQKRLLEHINQQAAALREEAERAFVTAVTGFLQATDNLDEAETAAQQRLADAVEAFFSARYQPFSQGIQTEVTALLNTYANQADGLINELRRLAADLFAFDFAPLNPDAPPTRLQTPYWTRSALMGGLGLPISPGSWERLLPPAKRRTRILNRLQPLTEELALRNTEHLRWAVVQNTQQVLRQFRTHLDGRWQETIEATAQVLETAVAQRAQHAAASADTLAELDQLIDAVHALIDELSEL